MKRQFRFNTRILAVLLCMLLMLGACSSSASEDGTDPSDSADSSVTQDEDTADTGGTEEEGEKMGLLFPEDEAYLIGINPLDYVTLPDYNALPVVLDRLEVTEADIDTQLTTMAPYYLESVTVTDRTVAQNGDTVTVDYSGRIKETDEVFAGGTAEDQTVTIGGEGYIEGFAEAFASHAIDEEFEFEVTFPDPYPNNTDLSGVEVIFTATIHSITVTPEFDDDNVSVLQIDGVETLSDLRDYIRDALTEQNEAQQEEALREAVVEAIAEQSTFADELPERFLALYEHLLKQSLEQQALYLQMYGYTDITADSLLEQTMLADNFTGTPEEYLTQEARTQAQQILAYYAVAESEDGLKPSDEEVAETLENVLLQSGMEDETEYNETYGFRLSALLYQDMLSSNVVSYLTEHANITWR